MNQIAKETVREQVGQSVGVSGDVVRSILLHLSELIAQNSDQGVLVDGLGEFKAVRGEPRQVRNPATGEVISVPGSIGLIFEPDTYFLESCTRTVDNKQLRPVPADLPSEPEPLPEIRLVPDAADCQAAGVSDSLAKACKHKVGGEPNWIQYPDVPNCCGGPMQFYGQFDSRLGDEFNIVDCGMLYVFYCGDCWASISRMQTY